MNALENIRIVNEVIEEVRQLPDDEVGPTIDMVLDEPRAVDGRRVIQVPVRLILETGTAAHLHGRTIHGRKIKGE